MSELRKVVLSLTRGIESLLDHLRAEIEDTLRHSLSTIDDLRHDFTLDEEVNKLATNLVNEIESRMNSLSAYAALMGNRVTEYATEVTERLTELGLPTNRDTSEMNPKSYKICTNAACRIELPPDAKYCDNCGSRQQPRKTGLS